MILGTVRRINTISIDLDCAVRRALLLALLPEGFEELHDGLFLRSQSSFRDSEIQVTMSAAS